MIAASLIALLTLTAMEIVLGIDNIVFISILTSKLPIDQQSSARRIGLFAALALRILLLSLIFLLVHLTTPIIQLDRALPLINALQPMFIERDSAGGHGFAPSDSDDQSAPKLDQHAWDEFVDVSWRDIILIAGGLFLLFKSVKEIHGEMEGHAYERSALEKPPSFRNAIGQIVVMDIIFSLDSVITAVGMANQLWVMIAAVVIAVGVMILFANRVGRFVDGNPTIKMLALNFLLLIGVMLIAEGLGTPISKAYIYFAMAFSLAVEFLNIRVRKKEELADR